MSRSNHFGLSASEIPKSQHGDMQRTSSRGLEGGMKRSTTQSIYKNIPQPYSWSSRPPSSRSGVRSRPSTVRGTSVLVQSVHEITSHLDQLLTPRDSSPVVLQKQQLHQSKCVDEDIPAELQLMQMNQQRNLTMSKDNIVHFAEDMVDMTSMESKDWLQVCSYITSNNRDETQPSTVTQPQELKQFKQEQTLPGLSSHALPLTQKEQMGLYELFTNPKKNDIFSLCSLLLQQSHIMKSIDVKYLVKLENQKKEMELLKTLVQDQHTTIQEYKEQIPLLLYQQSSIEKEHVKILQGKEQEVAVQQAQMKGLEDLSQTRNVDVMQSRLEEQKSKQLVIDLKQQVSILHIKLGKTQELVETGQDREDKLQDQQLHMLHQNKSNLERMQSLEHDIETKKQVYLDLHEKYTTLSNQKKHYIDTIQKLQHDLDEFQTDYTNMQARRTSTQPLHNGGKLRIDINCEDIGGTPLVSCGGSNHLSKPSGSVYNESYPSQDILATPTTNSTSEVGGGKMQSRVSQQTHLLSPRGYHSPTNNSNYNNQHLNTSRRTSKASISSHTPHTSRNSHNAYLISRASNITPQTTPFINSAESINIQRTDTPDQQLALNATE